MRERRSPVQRTRAAIKRRLRALRVRVGRETTYRLWRAARSAVSGAPLPVAYRGATVVANIGWLLVPSARANATANYAQMLGPGREWLARALARRSFVAYAHYAVDFIRSGAATTDEILGMVEFDDWERLREVVARGRGVILVLTHFGNWDAGGQALALYGYPLAAIAETQHGPINDDFVQIRTVRGVTLIPMERGAAGIVRALRKGGFLAILIDRPLETGGIEVEFFGGKVRVPEGPARLALRTGAAIVPGCMVRLQPGSDRVRALLDFDIEVPATGDAARDAQLLTQRVMASHECMIRRHPEQWYMFRRFWQQPKTP